MLKWNEIYDSVSKTTKKTKDKTKTLASITSLRVKLNSLEISISEEYDTLGRIYYYQEVGKVDNSEAIKAQLKFISDINKQINAIKAEIRDIKKAAALANETEENPDADSSSEKSDNEEE